MKKTIFTGLGMTLVMLLASCDIFNGGTFEEHVLPDPSDPESGFKNLSLEEAAPIVKDITANLKLHKYMDKYSLRVNGHYKIRSNEYSYDSITSYNFLHWKAYFQSTYSDQAEGDLEQIWISYNEDEGTIKSVQKGFDGEDNEDGTNYDDAIDVKAGTAEEFRTQAFRLAPCDGAFTGVIPFNALTLADYVMSMDPIDRTGKYNEHPDCVRLARTLFEVKDDETFDLLNKITFASNGQPGTLIMSVGVENYKNSSYKCEARAFYFHDYSLWQIGREFTYTFADEPTFETIKYLPGFYLDVPCDESIIKPMPKEEK